MTTDVVLGGATFQKQEQNRFFIPLVVFLPIVEQYIGKAYG